MKAKLVKNLEDWLYSTYLEFIGKRNSGLFDMEFFKENYESYTEYELLMRDYEFSAKGIEGYLIDEDK